MDWYETLYPPVAPWFYHTDYLRIFMGRLGRDHVHVIERHSPRQGHHNLIQLAKTGYQPLFAFKITGDRLLSMTLVTSFGAAKAILTYQGQSVLPTTMDWVLGGIITIW